VNLIIDQGNTVTKVAIFKADVLVETFLYEVFDANVCAALLSVREIDRCIFSSVVNSSGEVIEYLKNRIPSFLFIDEKVSLPIKNNYKTPKTLGKDRLAAAIAANAMFPGENVLVVDVGTAITYELVDSFANYLGGNISPGVSMRFKALHKFTDKLPLVDRFGDLPQLGYDTETAIRSGVVQGVVWEIKSYITLLREKYSNLKVILTGGHTRYIESQLDIKVYVDINLVLKGLNRILNYNVEV
jgi:type III pantothenate kinase